MNKHKSNLETPADDVSVKLREFYDAVAHEPIPDRFLDLLAKLDEAEERGRPQQDPSTKG